MQSLLGKVARLPFENIQYLPDTTHYENFSIDGIPRVGISLQGPREGTPKLTAMTVLLILFSGLA